MEIVNLNGGDKLVADIIRLAAEDYNDPARGRWYRSAGRFLRDAGLLKHGRLDERLKGKKT